MKKYTFLLIFVFVFTLVSFAYAQEPDITQRVTPTSFFGRAFEGVGTFFTFGNAAKAERYLLIAERRLAEAEALAKTGDERAEDAVQRYEAQIERAQARASRTDNPDLIERVADNTTRHISTLDEVLERVPEEARDAIRTVRERAVEKQIEMLRDLGDIAPERSVDVFSRAAEARLKAAEARALRGGANETEDIEETLFEYEKYAEFGREISELGQGLRVGETTVEELVERAGQQHLDVLRRVQQQVPFEAQEGIRRALENAEAVRDARPIVPGQNEDLEAARSRLFQREQERAPSQTEDDFDAARFDETRFGKVSPTIPAPVTRELPQTDTVRDEASRLEETPLRILPSSTPIPTPIREQDKVESLPVRSISPTPVTPIPTTSVVPVPSVIEVPAPSVVEVPVRVLATIQGFAFSPASITVKKGTTIVWTNKDSVGHTVTGGGGGPDSRLLGEGESYSFTFNNAGVFNYVCSPHPSMRGTVTVTE